MARILYGVMGDSGGHINRSLAVARELPEHDFLFVGGGQVKETLRHGYDYSPLPMISTVVKDNNVAVLATIANFCRIITGYMEIINNLCRVIEKFKPDLAITDYEFFLPKAARRCGVKCVSLDHQHIITHSRHTPPIKETLSRLTTTALIRHLFSDADEFIVSSFFDLPPADSTTIIPPIIHRDILNVTPSDGEHVVVYLRTGINSKLRSNLEAIGRECRIYGTGKGTRQGNLIFKGPSRFEFLHDVASSRYIICNGGHTLTSEALQLGKPVFALPATLFYEQYINSYFLKKLGYGDFANAHEDNDEALRRFDDHQSKYKKTLAGKDFFGNDLIANTIRSLVASC
nr:glycosyltransferase family protein [uncultured Pseudodesulfovibrio sp.]